MQTTITNQIVGIQQARQLILLVPSYAHQGEAPKIVKEADTAINDAGATLAALKGSVWTFLNACDTIEEKRSVAFEFFSMFNKEML